MLQILIKHKIMEASINAVFDRMITNFKSNASLKIGTTYALITIITEGRHDKKYRIREFESVKILHMYGRETYIAKCDSNTCCDLDTPDLQVAYGGLCWAIGDAGFVAFTESSIYQVIETIP